MRVFTLFQKQDFFKNKGDICNVIKRLEKLNERFLGTGQPPTWMIIKDPSGKHWAKKYLAEKHELLVNISNSQICTTTFSATLPQPQSTLLVESFVGTNFRRYKLSQTLTFKIKFRGD